MEDLLIECPLCCDETFDSKQALVDHMNKVLDNILCPLCNTKWASLEGLVEHLSLYDCQSVQNETVQNIVIYEQAMSVDNIENSDDIEISDTKPLTDVTELSNTETGTQFITSETYECLDENGEVNTMYEELMLTKQLSKPILQTQELKLIKDGDGEGQYRYMIVSQDDCELSEDSAFVTKRNNDGTISLTTVKVSEQSLASSEGVYNCNICKINFTSVMDHINSYHNNQEVHIENNISTKVLCNTIENEEGSPSSDKQTPRRVITDTGDIVEEPIMFKTEDVQQDSIDEIPQHSKLVLDKQGRVYTKRYMQIDKVTDTSPQTKTEKPGNYHKVITKKVQTKSGFTVKYHCVSCNVSFTNLNDFQTHPCKCLKYPCPRCPAAFENPKSLCAHMKVHKPKSGATDGSPDTPVLYECEVCSTVFPTNKSLKLHKRMHDPIKSRPIEPPVEPADGRDVTYRCNICEKIIPFEYRTIHENSHKTSDNMNCGICNKKFNSLEYLEMHMNVHNMDKVTVNKQDKSLPYKCLYCNRRFARPHEKVKHERIHTGEKPHACEICGKSFRVSYCLTLHMRTHTGARPYACPHCGKRFKAHSGYNHHLLTHSEVRAYKCPYCPKAFKTSVQLAGHKNSHTKPFSCQHCNRPFASLYAVRVHSETHARANNLKFSCALCGASYARAFALKDHVRQAHQQDAHSPDATDEIVDNIQDDDWIVHETAEEDSQDMTSLDNELHQDVRH